MGPIIQAFLSFSHFSVCVVYASIIYASPYQFSSTNGPKLCASHNNICLYIGFNDKIVILHFCNLNNVKLNIIAILTITSSINNFYKYP